MMADGTDLAALQCRLREEHVNGAFGALVSGLVWFVVGLALLRADLKTAFAVLFFGGMLIFPLAAVAGRIAGAPKGDDVPNPLEVSAFEGTAVLFAGLFVAYLLIGAAQWLVLPVVGLAIGVRYLTFNSLYGEPAYWLLGLALVAVSIAAALRVIGSPPYPFLIGGIEVVSGALLFARWRAIH